jgi:signal transduction histidine kinase
MDDAAPRIAGSQQGAGGHRNPSNASDVPLAAFAHELRNALGPLRTAAHLLRASVHDDAQAQWALDLIDRQVHSISASIDELADLARVMRGALPLGSDLVNLGEAVDSAASACIKALTERRQTLRWTRPADRMTVLGDSARLVQALAAVLRTMSRIAPASSQISVQLNFDRTEVETVICGISEIAPVETGGRADGAGSDTQAPLMAASIALSLARGIFALHGGSLDASGAASFAVRLPLARA